LFLYRLGIFFWSVALHIASVFNLKAKRFIEGRKKQSLVISSIDLKKCIWMHCASAGEFEQGRPILEELRKQYPERKILLTFYSPSGYELRKETQFADVVLYLPIDTPYNAKKWIQHFSPSLVIVVKNEFWYYLWKEVNAHQIPLILISATFRKTQWIMHPFAAKYREILSFFNHIFIQDDASAELLKAIGIKHYTIAGDTRIDRVIHIAQETWKNEQIELFVSNAHKVIVAGSTWPKDDIFLSESIKILNVKIIVAPHEITPAGIERIKKCYPSPVVLFSSSPSEKELIDAKTYILDTIGILNKIYRYADMAYVGGGFGKGIHNILEPAVYNIPVLFGPNHHKFPEAEWLQKEGIGIAISSSKEMEIQWKKIVNQNKYPKHSIPQEVLKHSGGTSRIMAYIQTAQFL
jgi:3-deoxy-D-manno-octulosonic-acid transferase